MEKRGVLKNWNDGKGFGFIQPDGGGELLFVHISSVRGQERPKAGDVVIYVAGSDAQGRPRAQHMRHVGAAAGRPGIRYKATTTIRPVDMGRSRQAGRAGRTESGTGALPIKLLVLLVLCVLPAWGSLTLLGQGVFWVLLAYPLVSLFSFCQYWLDKRSAQNGRWRTPENSLHIAELVGGWPGALVAQQMFRHKTRKASFQLVFWAIVALHQAFWIDQLALGGRYLGHLLPL